MISFDLLCAGGHVFEAWFRSSADYESQRAAGKIHCPTCDEGSVSKAIMAPAVAPKGNRGRPPAAGPDAVLMAAQGGEAAATLRRHIAALARAQRQALANSQWVGDSFAERARAIHYGESADAAIHGTADAGEARALIEEGVPVVPLLVPVVPPDRVN